MQRYAFFHGQHGYSTTKHSGRLGVRFIGPGGKRMERMTLCTRADANYHDEAKKIIEQVYTEWSSPRKTDSELRGYWGLEVS